MNIKNNQSFLFAIPAFFTIASIAAILIWGLKPGIDLAGGSMLQVAYDERPAVEDVNAKLSDLDYGEIRVQESNENDFILRQKELNGEEKQVLMDSLATLGIVREVQFNSVGPTIGHEIVRKSWWAIVLVALSIISFIAFVFRHVSKPVASWKYGIVAIATLLHDVLIPTGLFAYLGYARGAEVGVFFIVAILTTLGISINDTIVVFDRIRENLRLNEEHHRREIFSDVVWKSITQTLTRSINTSLTVIIMLVALFILGPDSTKDFALTLIVGMVAGTYSSILLASPLLVQLEKWQSKK
ncbi:MAG: protein translocase subunit SecF [Candidatus Pacebacteria bacterium]|nr:protein translocase subunit SecF [Candidatus Paceibacterota bacterium]MCF7856906.1 protein translocase subunit SecF [Candidatus Paceibacterota bacterium]